MPVNYGRNCFIESTPGPEFDVQLDVRPDDGDAHLRLCRAISGTDVMIFFLNCAENFCGNSCVFDSKQS
jgi:hypothetical protein